MKLKPRPLPASFKDWPKELQQALILERQGFIKQASALRKAFHARVLTNDPTTGITPFIQGEPDVQNLYPESKEVS